MKVLQLSIITLLVLLFITSDASEKPKNKKVVVANEILLVDQDGNRRAALGFSMGTPGLFFFDKHGKTRLSIGMPYEKPYLNIGGLDGVSIRVFIDGSELKILVYNQLGVKVASFEVDKKGLPRLNILKAYDGNRIDSKPGFEPNMTEKELMAFFKAYAELSEDKKIMTEDEIRVFIRTFLGKLRKIN